MKTYKGIDVSLYQGAIDWSRVKAAGIDFAMIKASQGRTAEYDAPFTDPRFDQNIKGALSARMMIGCYHYLCCRSRDEARAEAEYFVSLLLPHGDGINLWAAVDVEDSATVGALPREEITECVKIFCDTVRSAGLRPMVYGSTWWLDDRYDPPAGVPIWEANLSVAARPARARIWQRSFTGRVDGIEGDVDLDEGVDIIGDADGDGSVTVLDSIAAALYALGVSGITLDFAQGDTDMDGAVTLSDALEILSVAISKRP